MKNMRKSLFVIILLLSLSCAYASDLSVDINGVDFEIPEKYQGGKDLSNGYRFENRFSIYCIDDDLSSHAGFWGSKKEFSQDLKIGNHPVRHYCAYNQYVGGNYSHAYFTSGNSVYEINWMGNNITADIEKLIIKTPDSQINEDEFYNELDDSVGVYKEKRNEQLEDISEYNYNTAKYNPYSHEKQEMGKINEILITIMNQKKNKNW